ncbi:MAG TPA: alpha/beta hydrolase [Dehalococcoidia bacterium]|nr:alpha/beta hydrolase [Dehalococcoidia bacterium]
MALIAVNGAELDVRDNGAGDTVLFIHGGMGDECAAVVSEPPLLNNYRVIDYHRRGWGNSSCPETPITIEQQSVDAAAILRHLGLKRAHVVGQSYGGVIALQLTQDAPELVHTLALLEPALPSVLFNSADFGAMFGEVGNKYASGDKEGAIETFASEVGGANFRAQFDKTLPPGHFERWVAAGDTMFVSEQGSLDNWSFTADQAAQFTRPVLNIRGESTRPYFTETYETVRTWFPQAENVVLPDANHCILQTNPGGAAERLASFFASHPTEG